MKGFLNFFARWVVPVLGLLALSLIIWFLGPLLRLGNYEPLASATSRWVLIVLLFLVWIGFRVLRIVQARRNAAKVMQSLAEVSAPDAASVATAEELATLKQRMDEALALLKRAKLGGSERRNLYELPWYVIIGPPGSGKTTALMNSGLDFPLAAQMGAGAIRGVGGTRNCDWWFTDEAVLLDTAGRYTTQDSHAQVDKAAWLGFLDLLKTQRKRRPIDGAFIAISLSDLLLGSDAERAAHAQAIRARIQEPVPAARGALPDLRDADQVRPGAGLHGVLRQPEPRGTRAGLGDDLRPRRRQERGRPAGGVRQRIRPARTASHRAPGGTPAAGARPGAARPGLRLPAAIRRPARMPRRVPQRRVQAQPLRGTPAVARPVLHQRNPGRQSDRPPDRQHGAVDEPRPPAPGAADRNRAQLLHRAAVPRSGVRRTRPGRHQPEGRAPPQVADHRRAERHRAGGAGGDGGMDRQLPRQSELHRRGRPARRPAGARHRVAEPGPARRPGRTATGSTRCRISPATRRAGPKATGCTRATCSARSPPASTASC